MKKRILIIIIAILLVAVIAGAVVIGVLLNKNKTVGSTWGDTYYAYLSEAKNEKNLDNALEKYGIDLNMKEAFIQFCKVGEGEVPAMIMTYKKNDSNYVNVYQITDDNKVTFIAYKQPTKVEFLYNIENEDYGWYIHKETSTNDSYSSLNNIIDILKENSKQSDKSKNVNVAELEADYTIEKSDSEIVQKDADGREISIKKFDTIFVRPDVDLNEKLDFNINMSDKDLKEKMTKGVNNYKKESKIVTKDVKEKVSKQVEKINKKIKEIEDAKKGITEKEKEENDNKNKNKGGITVGNYTIKYGKYIGSDGATGSTLEFKEDGTCNVTANWSSEGVSTKSFTYKIGNYNYSQDITPDYHEGIGLYDDNNNLCFSFLVASDTRVTDNDIGVYDYEGTVEKIEKTEDNKKETNTVKENTNTTSATTSVSNVPADIDDVYKDYIKNKEYERYTKDWEVKPTSYCMCDINQDGQKELLIASDNDLGWQYIQINTYDKSSKKVIEVANAYAYGGLRYSPSSKLITYTEIRPSQGAMGYGFYEIKNNKLTLVKTVGSDDINSFFVEYEGQALKHITEDECRANFDGYDIFEFSKL